MLSQELLLQMTSLFLDTGLRTAAFFFGHQVMHLIDIFVQPAIFMSLYYTLTLPEIKFMDYYISMQPIRVCCPFCHSQLVTVCRMKFDIQEMS